ncbi:hypothetical protein Acr_10g0009020 [Actinidia rufa]|uniref:PB1-like domain-containing protein n=1 Tax=Actinidia rufa TaxID=165716 RepID=A0A7J0FCA0_9ERIC|nr:hypothetical protein Acr_10g0009020 [Actinidia rufa]
MTKTMFALQILYGGKFVQGEQVTYVNGEEYISTVDSDFMPYFELMDIMKDIGYPNHPIVYYKLPNSDMNTDLVKLTSDRKKAGRPKKNRKKAEDEPKIPIQVRKHYTSLRCGAKGKIVPNKPMGYNAGPPLQNQTSGSGGKQ